MGKLTQEPTLAALPCVAASVALPLLSYRLQPRFCIEHLFLPHLLPALVCLCLAGGAAQGLVRWPPLLRLALTVLVALSLQSDVLVPCVSSLEESRHYVRLMALSWHMAWVAAAALAATAVGLCRSRQQRVAASVAATGFAVAAGHFALGAAKQYLAATGVVSTGWFAAFAEARTPVWLMGGTSLAVVGTGVAHVQRWRRPGPFGSAPHWAQLVRPWRRSRARRGE